MAYAETLKMKRRKKKIKEKGKIHSPLTHTRPRLHRTGTVRGYHQARLGWESRLSHNSGNALGPSQIPGYYADNCRKVRQCSLAVQNRALQISQISSFNMANMGNKVSVSDLHLGNAHYSMHLRLHPAGVQAT